MEDYIKLAFRVDKHIPGFVDSYFGPTDIRSEIEEEKKREPDELLDNLVSLRTEIANRPELDETRKMFVSKQLEAIEVLLREITGQKFEFEEYVSRLFDTSASVIPNDVLLGIKERLIRLILKSTGKNTFNSDMLSQWEAAHLIKGRELFAFADKVLTDYREITRTLVPLPNKENAILRQVSKKPWAAYNWYQGNGLSTIEINTDTPRTRYDVMTSLAHEIYPGHHTELSIKELTAFKENDYLETSAQLLNTPMCMVSEGIAECAFVFLEETSNVVDSYIDPTEQNIAQGLSELRMGAWVNATFLLHKEGLGDKEAARYLGDVSLLPMDRAERSLGFHHGSLTKAYAATYWWGKKLIRECYENAKKQSKTHEFFMSIYTLPQIPSGLLKNWEQT